MVAEIYLNIAYDSEGRRMMQTEDVSRFVQSNLPQNMQDAGAQSHVG